MLTVAGTPLVRAIGVNPLSPAVTPRENDSDRSRPSYNALMNNVYRAIIRREGLWWVGWIEEVPGVNCQEPTRDELMVSLREALRDMLEMNREAARSLAGDDVEQELISA